jgi:YfiH family protein
VGDAPVAVAKNRARLRELAQLPAEPRWLEQVHGTAVVSASDPVSQPCADASYSRQQGEVCVVLTADCLPLLLCRRDASAVAAVHAGWRGLQAGVIEETIIQAGEGDWLAWLGPAIGPHAFEVGEEVYSAFVDEDAAARAAFVAKRPGHWLADLYMLARMRLARVGVTAVYGGEDCTYSDPQRFYSYRRDGVTGRMASLIWLG